MRQVSLAFVLWLAGGFFCLAQPIKPMEKRNYSDYPPDIRTVIQDIDKDAEALSKVDAIDFHKAANKFASDAASAGGLGLFRDDARKVADELSKLPEKARG